MTVLRLNDVNLDATDVSRMVAFWAAALVYTHGDDSGQYVQLLPPEPGMLKIVVQRVSETRTAKNRVHLDCCPDDGDLEGEVQRLVELGHAHGSCTANPAATGGSWPTPRAMNSASACRAASGR